jgi:hypothetical protein
MAIPLHYNSNNQFHKMESNSNSTENCELECRKQTKFLWNYSKLPFEETGNGTAVGKELELELLELLELELELERIGITILAREILIQKKHLRSYLQKFFLNFNCFLLRCIPVA